MELHAVRSIGRGVEPVPRAIHGREGALSGGP